MSVRGFIRPGAEDAEPAVEANGLFIIPRWAGDDGVPEGIGSLD